MLGSEEGGLLMPVVLSLAEAREIEGYVGTL